jgi:hypothetical protein
MVVSNLRDVVVPDNKVMSWVWFIGVCVMASASRGQLAADVWDWLPATLSGPQLSKGFPFPQVPK